MNSISISDLLTNKGLKVTPQRVAVLQFLSATKIHPTADDIYSEVSRQFPNISLATIYNTLDFFTERGLIRRVRTEGELLRYDAILEPHHHLFCAETGKLEDYFDEELDTLIRNYFRQKPIDGFQLSDFQLNINGNFKS